MDEKIHEYIIKNYIDGVITVSAMNKSLISNFAEKTPIRVVEPFISEQNYDVLEKLDPSPTTTKATTISAAREHKGVDLLVKAWPTVLEHFPKAELHIVGPNHPSYYGETENVEVKGFVEDLSSELAESSLYIHPSRYDSFGISVIEAGLSGTVPIVTETTGSKSVVSPILEDHVVPPDPRSISKAVIEYYKQDYQYRKSMSYEFKHSCEEFAKEKKIRKFTEVFYDLVQEFGL
jgi:glycosyltransferase involved in cell wall biosynthesis